MENKLTEQEKKLIEAGTRTKNCTVCGDLGYLCDDCRESLLNVLDEDFEEVQNNERNRLR